MIPEKVFHYTKSSIALEKILCEKNLQIGQLKFTNDPKETKEHSFERFIGEVYDEQSWRDFDKRLTRIAKQIKLNEWKTLCVSKNHPDFESDGENQFLSGSFRPSMWAHYGENHKGVCLQLNGMKLDEQIKNAFPEVHSGDVEYSDKLLYNSQKEWIPKDKLEKLNDTDLREWLRKYFIRHHEAIFLKKSKDWENEYEFRWLVHNEKDCPEFIPIINNIVEEIVLGCDFHIAYLESLFKFCGDLGIQVYKIYWTNGRPDKRCLLFDNKRFNV